MVGNHSKSTLLEKAKNLFISHLLQTEQYFPSHYVASQTSLSNYFRGEEGRRDQLKTNETNLEAGLSFFRGFVSKLFEKKTSKTHKKKKGF